MLQMSKLDMKFDEMIPSGTPRGSADLESLEMHGFSGLEGVSDIVWCLRSFGGPIEEKVSDLGGLEGLESLEMHGFSGLQGMSGVIRCLGNFGSPVEEKCQIWEAWNCLLYTSPSPRDS